MKIVSPRISNAYSSQWRTKLGVCQFHGAVNRAANDGTVVWCRILEFMVAIVIECGPRMRSSGVLFTPLSGGLWLSVDMVGRLIWWICCSQWVSNLSMEPSDWFNHLEDSTDDFRYRCDVNGNWILGCDDGKLNTKEWKWNSRVPNY